MHFAHGAAIGAGAYIFWFTGTQLAWPWWAAIPTAVLFAGGVGVAIHAWVYEPLRRRGASSVIVLIAGVTLLLFFQNLWQLVFGARVKVIPLTGQLDQFLGATLSRVQELTILLSATLFAVLFFAVEKTSWGRRLRAIADHRQLAEISGIQVEREVTWVFLIASMLAGVAGVLAGLERNVYPGIGTPLLVSAFTGAVLGGLDRVGAAVAGCFLLGLLENGAVWFLPSGYKEAVSFGLLFLFLIFRPKGLFSLSLRRI